MQLTKFSDYALRVLMYAQAAGGRLVTIEDMAGSYRISRSHLMMIVNALTCAGYRTAVRGRSGALKLARTAAKIRLGDVVRATEPDFSLVECSSTGNAIATGCCRLPRPLNEALDAFLGALDRHTLTSISLTEGLPRGAAASPTDRGMTVHATQLPSCAQTPPRAVSLNRSRRGGGVLKGRHRPPRCKIVMIASPHHSGRARADRLIFGS